jgi:hypothetical protein
LSEKDLEFELVRFLKEKQYFNIQHSEGEYIIAEGESSICLVAHLDTVFTQPPKWDEIYYDKEHKVMWSPYGTGFDDRAGVAMIVALLEHTYFKPSIIFTMGEELGGIGASALTNKYKRCPFKKCNFLIELDRQGANDCVFYSCDNKEFIEYIKSFGYKMKTGSFSDISFIMPVWGIAGVNLSVGYLDEHSFCERLRYDWYMDNFRRLKDFFYNEDEDKFYKYIPKKKNMDPIFLDIKNYFDF